MNVSLMTDKELQDRLDELTRRQDIKRCQRDASPECDDIYWSLVRSLGYLAELTDSIRGEQYQRQQAKRRYL